MAFISWCFFSKRKRKRSIAVRRQAKMGAGYLSSPAQNSLSLHTLHKDLNKVFINRPCFVFVCCLGGLKALGSLDRSRKGEKGARRSDWKLNSCGRPFHEWLKRPNHINHKTQSDIETSPSKINQLLSLFVFIKCSHHIGFGTCWTEGRIF